MNNGYDLIDTANRWGKEGKAGKELKISGKERNTCFIEAKPGQNLYEKDSVTPESLQRLAVTKCNFEE